MKTLKTCTGGTINIYEKGDHLLAYDFEAEKWMPVEIILENPEYVFVGLRWVDQPDKVPWRERKSCLYDPELYRPIPE